MSSQLPKSEPVPLELPGAPGTWIWAFTCPTPGCACRVATVLASTGDKETLLARGRPVADAWRDRTGYLQAAQDLNEVLTFEVELDTREVYSLMDDAPLDPQDHPEIVAIAERLDDGIFDEIARDWYRGKGKPVPPAPDAEGPPIEIEGWRPGSPLAWASVQPALCNDTYFHDDRVFHATDLYCVEPGCTCTDVIIDFDQLAPRGAPHPGHVEFTDDELNLRPAHPRHLALLSALWDAFCRRHPAHRARFVHRSEVMHSLAGRIVAAPPPKPKIGRNAPCPCGSGLKYKKCCGAVGTG